jgi:hypothetical protein
VSVMRIVQMLLLSSSSKLLGAAACRNDITNISSPKALAENHAHNFVHIHDQTWSEIEFKLRYSTQTFLWPPNKTLASNSKPTP